MSSPKKNPKALAGANGPDSQLNLFNLDSKPKRAYFFGTDNPRHIRVLKALVKFKEVSRITLNGIAGAANLPQLMSDLRDKGLGNDHLVCKRKEQIDRDGRACLPGYYSLSSEGKRVVGTWLFKNGYLKGSKRG
jgi:hypothetical protein